MAGRAPSSTPLKIIIMRRKFWRRPSLGRSPPRAGPGRERVRFLNTVIGKMSGVVADAGEAQAAAFVHESLRAVLAPFWWNPSIAF